MNKKYSFIFYPEVCCDYCMETVNNYFDCPICETEYANTSIYSDVYLMDLDETFICDECDSEFTLISKHKYDTSKYVFKYVETSPINNNIQRIKNDTNYNSVHILEDISILTNKLVLDYINKEFKFVESFFFLESFNLEWINGINPLTTPLDIDTDNYFKATIKGTLIYKELKTYVEYFFNFNNEAEFIKEVYNFIKILKRNKLSLNTKERQKRGVIKLQIKN